MRILKIAGLAVLALVVIGVLGNLGSVQKGAERAIDEASQTASPTTAPTVAPTPEPTEEPTPEPTAEPTAEPTLDAAAMTTLAMQMLLDNWSAKDRTDMCSAYQTLGEELFLSTFMGTMEQELDAATPYDHDAATATLRDWMKENCS